MVRPARAESLAMRSWCLHSSSEGEAALIGIEGEESGGLEQAGAGDVQDIQRAVRHAGGKVSDEPEAFRGERFGIAEMNAAQRAAGDEQGKRLLRLTGGILRQITVKGEIAQAVADFERHQ